MRHKLDDRGENCIFVGYSKQSKAYKFYNLITKKLIIGCHVEFLEEEAWDGNLDNSTIVAASVPQEIEENETQDMHSTTKSNVPQTPTRAPITQNTTTPTRTNSSESSNPTLTSLRSRSINTSRKTSSLKDIYDELQEAENHDSCINFSLSTHANPIYFEEAIKDDKWILAMDGEIQSIEKNDTWDLVDFSKGEDVIGVK